MVDLDDIKRELNSIKNELSSIGKNFNEPFKSLDKRKLEERHNELLKLQEKHHIEKLSQDQDFYLKSLQQEQKFYDKSISEQNKLSNYTKWLAIFTIVLAFGTFCMVGTSFYQTIVSNKLLNLEQQSFVSPWPSLSVENFENKIFSFSVNDLARVEENDSSSIIDFHKSYIPFDITNQGNKPAEMIFIKLRGNSNFSSSDQILNLDGLDTQEVFQSLFYIGCTYNGNISECNPNLLDKGDYQLNLIVECEDCVPQIVTSNITIRVT